MSKYWRRHPKRALLKLARFPSSIIYWALFGSLAYFAFLLPFQVKELPITLGLMVYGLFWLLSLRPRQDGSFLFANRLAWWPMLYFFWIACGALYSPLWEEAQEDLILKIPFLVWPLLLGSRPILGIKSLNQILTLFIMALAVGLLWSLILALWRFNQSHSAQEFFFSPLMSWSTIAPHYWGMYLNFGLGVLLHRWFKGRPLAGNNALHLSLLGWFCIGILLMAVRMQYVIFFMLVLGSSFFHLRKQYGTIRTSAGTGVALLIVLGILLLFKPTRHRLIDTYNELRSYEQMVDNKQTNARKFLWQGATEVLKEHWLWGTGTGAGSEPLNQQLEHYPEAIFWDGRATYHITERHYNYHNVYLQHWATNGLPGLLLISGFFLWPCICKPRYFKAEARLFLLVSGLSFVTESMLERQAGVLFFSFFYVLLLLTPARDYPLERQP